MSHDSIFRRLANQEKVTPYFEAGLISQNWPLKYTIEIDSSPYYGTGDGKFHPSTHPHYGDRLNWYMLHPVYSQLMIPERRSVQSEMMLSMGSAIHGIVQTQFKMMKICKCDCDGPIHTCDDIEVEYRNDEHNVRGRLDFRAHLPEETVLVELKTQNIYSFDADVRAIDRSSPSEIWNRHPEWDIQMSMEEDCLGAASGILLVVKSGWPFTMKEYHHTRNDSLLSENYQKFDRVLAALEMDRPPKHCCALGSETHKSCPARTVCWDSEEKV